MILTEQELRDLTGRRVRSSQVKVLRYMGIDHKVRPDGSVAVLRAHVEHQMGAKDPAPAAREVEPNWAAI